MELFSVFTAFTAFSLLLANGFPVIEDDHPSIIGPHQVQIRTSPGELLLLHCDALTNQGDVTLIYWLVNGTFPEDTASSERIEELEESTSLEGAILQRSLLLKKVTPEDLRSNFTCVVINTIGEVRKFITITTEVPNSN